MIGRACLVLACLAFWSASLGAQDGPGAACADVSSDPTYCRRVALGAEVLLPMLVLSAEGGNPVPGTASTLGMRLTSMPRLSTGGRLTLSQGSAPDLMRRGAGNTTQITPAAFAIDASVGVLPGLSPLPTVGGVGSLDLLIGAAVVPLLDSSEYGGSGGWSWAAGARVGILRESFTLPGIAVSAMYRQLRDVRLGDDELQASDSYIRTDLSVLSARAAASKAILLFTLVGGVGWDRMSGDIELGYETGTGPVRITADDASMDRLTAFGELSYTLMVMSFVIGAGVQTSADVDDAITDFDSRPAWFASGAMRLSI